MKAYMKQNGKLYFRPGAAQIENFLIAAIPGVIATSGVGVLAQSWAFTIISPVIFLIVIYAALFKNKPLQFTVEVSEREIILFAFKTPIFFIPICQIHSVGTTYPDVGSRLCNQRGVFLSLDYVTSLEQLKKEARIAPPLFFRRKHNSPNTIPGRWIHLGDFEISEAQSIVNELRSYLNRFGSKN